MQLFFRPGLGKSKNISSFKDVGDGLELDRGGGGITC